MRIKLVRYFSILTLLGFLFPFALNEVHELSHKDDFHCSEKISKHFHEQSHHCSICDFVVSVSDSPFVSSSKEFILSFSSVSYSPIIPIGYVSSFKTNRHLRGPPTIWLNQSIIYHLFPNLFWLHYDLCILNDNEHFLSDAIL